MKTEFQFYNGSKIQFEFLDKKSNRQHLGSNVKKYNDLPYFEVNNKCFLDIPGFYIIFDTFNNLQLFVHKIVFFRLEKLKKLIFFEIINSEELKDLIHNFVKFRDTSLSIEGNVDVYVLNDGKVLSADAYGRNGEIFQNIEDYLAIKNYVFKTS